MNKTILTQNIDLQIAKTFYPQKISTNITILSSIISLSRSYPQITFDLIAQHNPTLNHNKIHKALFDLSKLSLIHKSKTSPFYSIPKHLHPADQIIINQI